MSNVPDPQDLSVAQLVALDAKGFRKEMTTRLRRNDYWPVLLDPRLIDRTRYALVNMVASIDAQRLRAAQAGTTTREWLRAINALQRWAQERLDAMPPAPDGLVSGAREARAWRALSARLAEELERVAPESLESFQTPYGALNMRQWLAARREKEQKA